MPRERLTFRQRDLTAAIKAVKAAGDRIARIEIDRGGKIVVIPAGEAQAADAGENEWDKAYS